MTTDTETTTITDEQKAEWSDLHDRAHKMFDEAERAETMVAYYFADHIAAGGMAPAEFGLPSPDAIENYRRACEKAADATALREQRDVLLGQIADHPYTAVIAARRAAQ